MNTTENNHELTWTSKKVWGAVGLTHHTEVTIAGAHYAFTVDQPRKGQWIARGWRNGDMFYYRDEAKGRTLTGAKGMVDGEVGRLMDAAEADKAAVDLAEDEPECWCEWVDIGVGMQRVAEIPGCPEHHPDPLEDLPEDYVPGRPVVDLSLPEVDMTEAARRLNAWAGDANKAMSGMGRHFADSMNAMTHLFRTAFHHQPCGCPTPTHRMSCGVGATPKVVSR